MVLYIQQGWPIPQTCGLQLIKLFIPILVVSIFLLKDHVFLCGLAKKFPEPLQ